jgi:hypothetical protein
MTNVESYGGSLPKSWIDSHIGLGKQIVDRELELGMKPIQQGLSGYVPRMFKERFTHAKIQKTKNWCNFEACDQLNPLDPLFQKFGKIFDYSWRGLIGGYYLPRWQKFFDMLKDNLANNSKYVEEGLAQAHGREALRANGFYDSLADWEQKWINTPKPDVVVNVGKELEIALALQKKYKTLMKEYYQE